MASAVMACMSMAYIVIGSMVMSHVSKDSRSMTCIGMVFIDMPNMVRPYVRLCPS